jgi:hypothetical protein
MRQRGISALIQRNLLGHDLNERPVFPDGTWLMTVNSLSE